MWKWKIIIILPYFIDNQLFQEGLNYAKGPNDCFLFDVKLEWIKEGPCAQIMYKVDMGQIPKILKELYNTFLPQKNLVAHGSYHERYLDKYDSFDPNNFKIVLR